MKYKDLRVGDWFTIGDDPTPYIHVKTSNGYINDIYFGDDLVSFGLCLLPSSNPNLEVHFVSELNLINPYFDKDASLTAKYPLCQFFQINFITGEPLILFTTYLGSNYTMFLNGVSYDGILNEHLAISGSVNVKVIPDISISFPEKA